METLLGDQLAAARSYYGAWPAWPWPAWTPQAPAFLYYEGSAYPTSMDACMQAQLPVCLERPAPRSLQGDALAQCLNTVFARCKDQTLAVASVYEPYPGA